MIDKVDATHKKWSRMFDKNWISLNQLNSICIVAFQKKWLTKKGNLFNTLICDLSRVLVVSLFD